MKPLCIIYYHGNDWDGVAARQRYLMSAMSHYAPVFYLDFGRDRRGRITWHAVSDRVTVIRGLVALFPFFDKMRLGWLKALYARWELRSIRHEYRKIIFWTAENWLRPYRFIPHDFLVFDVIDPSFDQTPAAVEAFQSRDEEVLDAADLVFASADVLVEWCSQRHTHVTRLNNACEPADYSDELLAAARPPAWWPASGKPIGAYLGTLDWRLDGRCLFEACSQNPEVHFVLAGAILPDMAAELAGLLALPNVTAPGRISAEDGRYLLAHCTFGMIPFTPGPMNDAINPVKMYAYALLGKPMLGTNVRELRDRPHAVQVATSPEAFGAMVPRVLELSNDPAYRESLRRFALANDWSSRARTAWEVLQQSLPL
jgi:hypothetical protein